MLKTQKYHCESTDPFVHLPFPFPRPTLLDNLVCHGSLSLSLFGDRDGACLLSSFLFRLAGLSLSKSASLTDLFFLASFGAGDTACGPGSSN